MIGDREKVLISFSGGRTSAYMTHQILKNKSADQTIVVVFANTGQEDEKTLQFVKDCDDNFGFNTVWVEAEVNPEHRKGTKHKIVDFYTASRDGKPYEDVTKKFGIANKVSPHCTREMKQRPITSYIRSLGWKPSTYNTAIGIRADEVDRMNPRAKEAGIIYPLVKWGISKKDILDWWSKQNFDLMLPEHKGNCVWCWKKSNRKLFTLIKEEPDVFIFPSYLEDKYGMYGPIAKKNNYPMKIFRGDKSTKEMIEEAYNTNFDTFVDQRYLDMNQGCEDSCEVFSTEDDIEELLKE